MNATFVQKICMFYVDEIDYWSNLCRQTLLQIDVLQAQKVEKQCYKTGMSN